MPVEEPIVAIAGLLLLHAPPLRESDSVVVNPTQIVDAPVITEGDASTVTTFVARQVPIE
jgi:hypothetical protein